VKVFAWFDAGFHLVDASHGVGQLEGGARMPFVDLSKGLVVVDNGFGGEVVVVLVVPLLRKVGLTLGFLFVENFGNADLAFSFSGLVLGGEPFEAANVELLFRVFVLFLYDLDYVHDFLLHALFLDGKIPAGDDFLVRVLLKGQNGSDHDNFVKGDTLSHSLALLLVIHDFTHSIGFVGIDHHGSHRFVEGVGFGWSRRPGSHRMPSWHLAGFDGPTILHRIATRIHTVCVDAHCGDCGGL